MNFNSLKGTKNKLTFSNNFKPIKSKLKPVNNGELNSSNIPTNLLSNIVENTRFSEKKTNNLMKSIFSNIINSISDLMTLKNWSNKKYKCLILKIPPFKHKCKIYKKLKKTTSNKYSKRTNKLPKKSDNMITYLSISNKKSNTKWILSNCPFNKSIIKKKHKHFVEKK